MNRGTRRGEEGKREREREVESQRGKIDRWIKPNRREAYRSFDSQSGFCWTTWHTRWLVFQGRNEPRSRHDDRDKIGRNDDGASPPHPATILRTNKSRVYAMLRKTPDDNQRPPPVVLALMVSPFRGHGEKSFSLSLYFSLKSLIKIRGTARFAKQYDLPAYRIFIIGCRTICCWISVYGEMKKNGGVAFRR